jgi:hypothetical protein
MNVNVDLPLLISSFGQVDIFEHSPVDPGRTMDHRKYTTVGPWSGAQLSQSVQKS